MREAEEGIPARAQADVAARGLLRGEKDLALGDSGVQEATLRPKRMEEFLGQARMKENLSVFIKAASERKEALDHVFLIGPPGLGKTTLAQVIAYEMGAEIKMTSAPALDKHKDLAGILASLGEGSVFFIDEIHRLKPALEEMLYIAMEDYELDWIIGQGPSARTIRVPIPPFTLIGATTKAGMVSSPLVSRFGITARFSFYEQADIISIIKRSAGILGIGMDEDACAALATCSRGTPRVANRLLKRMRDFAQMQGQDRVKRSTVSEGLSRLEIDGCGLERHDREILRSIIEKYGGGPVGAETLAITVGESVETLEDYYEPYLIQSGFLSRTPRGRIVTKRAFDHLGIEYLHENEGLLF
jgi:holliday junction DNA helicase RuvB